VYLRRIVIGLLEGVCAFAAAAPTTDIKVDQVGYLPMAPKFAMVVASGAPATEFTVRNVQGGAVALQGKLSAPAADVDSGDNVQLADFSKLTKTGKYYLEVSGVGRSWEFSIAPDVYARAYYLSMRAF
jgi:endoglucanase